MFPAGTSVEVRMFVLSKTRIKQILIVIAVVILIAVLSIGLGLAEAWIMHRYFPDPENYPWHNMYPIYPAFEIPDEGYAVYVDLDILQLTLYKDGKELKNGRAAGVIKTPRPRSVFTRSTESGIGERVSEEAGFPSTCHGGNTASMARMSRGR